MEEATRLFTELQQAYEVSRFEGSADLAGSQRSECKRSIPGQTDEQERAFYDSHRNVLTGATDEDLYDHVRSGGAATDSGSKMGRRRQGDPGVRLEQLMRFFDPKLARKLDDSNEVSFKL